MSSLAPEAQPATTLRLLTRGLLLFHLSYLERPHFVGYCASFASRISHVPPTSHPSSKVTQPINHQFLLSPPLLPACFCRNSWTAFISRRGISPENQTIPSHAKAHIPRLRRASVLIPITASRCSQPIDSLARRLSLRRPPSCAPHLCAVPSN